MFCLCITAESKGTIYPAFIEIHFQDVRCRFALRIPAYKIKNLPRSIERRGFLLFCDA
jgi:hypothetical protein